MGKFWRIYSKIMKISCMVVFLFYLIAWVISDNLEFLMISILALMALNVLEIGDIKDRLKEMRG